MNLQQETRRGYVISADMKKVWAVQMKLLEKLFEVCKKYDLKVWAEGGTLLGTIREKGYIPWDDDIDMAMLRPDYDKLMEVAEKEFQKPFFVQNGYTDKYANGMTKIRYDGTTAVLDKAIYPFRHHGIFIDIFPYDAVPDDHKKLDKMMAEARSILRPLKYYYFDSYSPFHPIRLAITLKGACLVKKYGAKELYKKYEDLFRQYRIEDNKQVSCHAWYYNLKRYARDKHWYDSTLWMPFEDIQMPVPSGYHEILSIQYGDYMTPAKAPSFHGGFQILDAEKPFQEVIPLLKKQHKWDNWKHRWHLLLKAMGITRLENK